MSNIKNHFIDFLFFSFYFLPIMFVSSLGDFVGSYSLELLCQQSKVSALCASGAFWLLNVLFVFSFIGSWNFEDILVSVWFVLISCVQCLICSLPFVS